jgi:hypothetical protein
MTLVSSFVLRPASVLPTVVAVISLGRRLKHVVSPVLFSSAEIGGGVDGWAWLVAWSPLHEHLAQELDCWTRRRSKAT